MPAKLWTPSAQRIDGANLTDFTKRYHPGASYPELHRASIAEPEAFWSAVWEYCAVDGKLTEPICSGGPAIADVRFFPAAELNFAANLLRGASTRIALVSIAEDGQRISWTMQQLRSEVSRVQQALASEGVGMGDRVAGIVPNTPEAIVTMLATLSLGAVWTSCSPDFGAAAIIDRFGQVEPKLVIAANSYDYNGKCFDLREKLVQVAARLPSTQRFVIFNYVKHTDLPEEMAASKWDEWLAPYLAKEPEFKQMPATAPGFILFSSGTTGKPKCIIHSTGGLLLKHLSELCLHADIKANDRLFFFTTCGWMMWNWLVSGLAVEATLVLFDGNPMYPQPDRLAKLAWQEGVTHFGASAKYFSSCEKFGVDPLTQMGIGPVRTVFSTGSPLMHESFDYLYRCWAADMHLASISGGTDICGCFVGGVPTLPVHRGEIQAPELGCDIASFNALGKAVVNEAGELVCRNAIPSMPLGFWGDHDGQRFHAAYFSKHADVWNHGDWVTLRSDGMAMVIGGRSDATLNPGGVRIGTAEIYRQVERIDSVLEAVAVSQDWEDDQRIVLFVRLDVGTQLTEGLAHQIRQAIRTGATPRHVPALIIAVADIPRTRSGKLAELAIRQVIHGKEIDNANALANPQALELYRDLPQLQG